MDDWPYIFLGSAGLLAVHALAWGAWLPSYKLAMRVSRRFPYMVLAAAAVILVVLVTVDALCLGFIAAPVGDYELGGQLFLIIPVAAVSAIIGSLVACSRLLEHSDRSTRRKTMSLVLAAAVLLFIPLAYHLSFYGAGLFHAPLSYIHPYLHAIVRRGLA